MWRWIQWEKNPNKRVWHELLFQTSLKPAWWILLCCTRNEENLSCSTSFPFLAKWNTVCELLARTAAATQKSCCAYHQWQTQEHEDLGKIKALLSFQGLKKLNGLHTPCLRACHYFPSVREWQCKGPFCKGVALLHGNWLKMLGLNGLKGAQNGSKNCICRYGMGGLWCNSHASSTIDPSFIQRTSSNLIAEIEEHEGTRMNLVPSILRMGVNSFSVVLLVWAEPLTTVSTCADYDWVWVSSWQP